MFFRQSEVGSMMLIPVLDLRGGIVVRARHGRREDYRPITTPLAPTSDPVAVLRGLLTIHAFTAVYVADLDAIERRGDQHGALFGLQAAYAGSLWVDQGIADGAAAHRFLEAGPGRLVLGSETQRDLALAREFAADARVLLSLDFRGETFLGPPALLTRPDLWPQEVIVMSLTRIGGALGPDIDRLEGIMNVAGKGRRIYAAGGVRDAGDLAALAQAGVAGALIASCLHDGRVTAAEIRRFI
jgi:phosphoribosylformimino-5-aminoimidazole carboxamide ribotide isomerase